MNSSTRSDLEQRDVRRPFCWLASYPKSGNTWLRMIIDHLSAQEGTTVGINEIVAGSRVNSRMVFDEMLGIDSSELTLDEIERLRLPVYRQLARRTKTRIYCKTHDAYRSARYGPSVPADVTDRAIYIVRNPFDLVISCAVFFDQSIDRMIDLMASADHALSAASDRYQPMLYQHLGRWSSHVSGWLDESDFPLLVIRYEDMVVDPAASFARIAEFIGLARDHASLAGVIEAVSFTRLQRQEALEGFRENHSEAALFFRRGQVGEGLLTLSTQQVARISEDHFEVLQRVGYVSANGQPAAIVRPRSLSE